MDEADYALAVAKCKVTIGPMSDAPDRRMEALNKLMSELRFEDKKYSRLAFWAHWILDGARLAALAIGIAAALAGYWKDRIPAPVLIVLPLLCSAATAWALRRHDLLGLRISGHCEYRHLLNKTEQEIADAENDSQTSEIHKKLVQEMDDIKKRQGALHLKILFSATKSPEERKAQKKLNS